MENISHHIPFGGMIFPLKVKLSLSFKFASLCKTSWHAATMFCRGAIIFRVPVWRPYITTVATAYFPVVVGHPWSYSPLSPIGDLHEPLTSHKWSWTLSKNYRIGNHCPLLSIIRPRTMLLLQQLCKLKFKNSESNMTLFFMICFRSSSRDIMMIATSSNYQSL